MKRIDSVNARPDVNGTGKAGFHDNTDLPGQDATYLKPDWLNAIQEELCNILEKNGIALDPDSKQQLYELLATNEDLLALAQAMEERFERVEDDVQDLQDAMDTLSDAQRDMSSTLQGIISSTSDALQLQISNLVASMGATYPKIRMAGVIADGQGDGWYEVHKPAGSNINFLDSRFVINLTCEAKSLDSIFLRRYADYFSVYVDVSDRNSGSDNARRTNYIVIESSGISGSSGDGDYTYTGAEAAFPILPGQTKSFLIIGGGGGGGSSRAHDFDAVPEPTLLKGENGQASYIRIDSTINEYVANGGAGGVGGTYSATQFLDGTGGAGGTTLVTGGYVSATPTNGQAGRDTAANHEGAATDSLSRGRGGNGADGYVNVGEGFGGGGGEGARLTIVYTNTTSQTQYARLYVGKAGRGERSLNTYNEDGDLVTPAANYTAGQDGENGFIRVSSAI